MPQQIFDSLYSYQRQGAAWLWSLYSKEEGGILADEMGLGKTIQVVSFLAGLKHAGVGARFLIAVPVTLIAQWQKELAKWTKDVGVYVHVLQGNATERRKALRGLACKDGVLLTSYDLVRSEMFRIHNAEPVLGNVGGQRKRKKTVVRDDDSPSEEEDMPVPAAAPSAPGGGRPWDAVFID